VLGSVPLLVGRLMHWLADVLPKATGEEQSGHSSRHTTHSSLKASTGSTLLARTAGTGLAVAATRSSTIGTVTKVNGSRASTPNIGSV
jgi:hypothetical protein